MGDAREKLEQARKAAELLGKGMSIRSALTEAGYSPLTAARGKVSITAPIRRALSKQGVKMSDIGREWLKNPEQLKGLVMGRVVENLVKGTDKGVNSAKLAGSWREINMWQPDSVSGVIVINAPTVKESALSEPPTIEAKK